MRSPRKKPPFKRAEVAWADAYSVDPWTTIEDLQAMIDRVPEYDDHATGYIVAENDRWVVFSNSVTYDEGNKRWSAAPSMIIPRGMVLREVKK